MTFLGNTVPITVAVTNPAGVPTDPATLTINVYRPDGSTDTYLIGVLTHSGTGAYGYPYQASVAGAHRYVATATVPPFVAEGNFNVTALDAAILIPRATGYLTAAEFKAMPTYLDLDDLIKGGTAGANDAELGRQLARAAAWCDNVLDGPTIGARLWTEQLRGRVDRDGMLTVRPRHTSGNIGIRQLISVAYGSSSTALTGLANLTGEWRQGGLISVPIGTYSGAWSGALQFAGTGPGAELFVRAAYVVGWPATVLSSATTAGATTFPVLDPTGIAAGDVLTIVDPGLAGAPDATEIVTVLSVAGSVITPVSPLSVAHTAGTGVSEVPPDLKQAIAFVARSFLSKRGNTTATKPTFGGSRVAQGTKTAAGQLATVDNDIAQALMILDSYARKTM